MKKKIICFLSIILAIIFCISLSACDDYANGEIKDDYFKNVNMPLVYEIYLDYMEEIGEEPLTYEEWFEVINGDEFQKGIIPEIRKNDTTDFWEISYNNGKGWNDLRFKTETEAQKDCKHTFGKWIILCEANDYFNGIRYRSCKHCNYKDYQFKLNGDVCLHLELETIVGQPATCIEEGLTDGKRCAKCGEIVVAQETLNKLNHIYDDEYDAVCNVCGHTREVSCAHTTLETLPAKDATCKESGLTEGKKCSKCGEIVVKQEIIDKVDHTYDDKYDAFCNVCGYERNAECPHTEVENIAGKPATCTAEGLTDGKKCVKCSEIVVEQETIGKLDHTIVIDEKVESTCKTTGLTEGMHCAECGDILVKQEIIPMSAEHTYDDEYDAVCNVCGYTREVGCAHTTLETLPAKDATCKESGLTEGKKCFDCGEIVVEQELIGKLEHTIVIDAGYAPSCTKSGLTDGKYCTRCDTVLVAQSEILATGHLLSIAEVVNPTCTEAGVTTYSCSACDYTQISEVINATGHNFIADSCVNCGKLALKPSEGLDYKLSPLGNYYIVTGKGTCTDNIIIIPSTYNGLPVQCIGERAFDCEYSITQFVIPSSVECIEKEAFSGYGAHQLIVKIGYTTYNDEIVAESEISKLSFIKSLAFAYCVSPYIRYNGDVQSFKTLAKDVNAFASNWNRQSDVIVVCNNAKLVYDADTDPKEFPSEMYNCIQITSKDQFTSGKYIIALEDGTSLGSIEETWITSKTMQDKGIVWELTINENGVIIKDSNGVPLSMYDEEGDNRVQVGEYIWTYNFQSDGTITFSGVRGEKTVYIAYNASFNGRFRVYRDYVVNGNFGKYYDYYFNIYKVI